MALGPHWEWRGFGAVSSNFVNQFCNLNLAFPKFPDPQVVNDIYLWVPGLEENVKFRPDIPQEPFKFKYIQDKDKYLEKWEENPEDIYKIPLSEQAWEKLSETLAKVNVTLSPYPSVEADAETTLNMLTKAGVIKITVKKVRESRLWEGPNDMVKVEWVCISSPQAIISIGLENWENKPGSQVLPDRQAKEDINSALEDLGINKEPLKPMNYLEAIKVWASKEIIEHSMS